MNSRERRHIYDTYLSPLLDRMEAIAKEHGFPYVIAVQYSPDQMAAEYYLPKGNTANCLKQAWDAINSSVLWEDEVEE